MPQKEIIIDNEHYKVELYKTSPSQGGGVELHLWEALNGGRVERFTDVVALKLADALNKLAR